MASLATKSIADGVTSRINDGGHALLPGPDPPDFEPVRVLRGFNHWFTCVTPLCLACRTQAIWRYWPVPALSGLLPPDPASPGSGCPPLHRTAATARRWGPTPHTVQQRLMAHNQAFEVACELRPRAGERDALGPRPVHPAPQPSTAATDLEPPDPEIQVPPDRVHRPLVLPRPRRVPALGADQQPAAQRDLDYHPSGSKRTFLTHTPGRRRSLENAVVTRTLSSSQAVDLQAASSLHGRAAARRRPTRNYQELPQAANDLLRRRIPRSP